ncbi:helicase HerA-like domain-containing protein [Methyloferula stellata]|uniref:helicase HerA-like domain-containing protein n=1 Tax=Methyloferula stellata TaxID=876270 RepID=UPI0003723738|nr:helicase HerA-like domain-containing protein [Methyloferula stellata]
MADDPNQMPGRIFLGKSDKPEYLTLSKGNRHGLITGATGTGKTVTLQLLAEGFAKAGTAVFAADIKGDLSGIAMPGDSKPAFVKRAADLGTAYVPDDFTTVFWDLFGEQGHPIRATISDMGPLLLARLLELNEIQEGVLNIAFKLADQQGLLLLDLKDLRALMQHLAEDAASLTTQYGNMAPSSIGAIQRQLLVLENQGATAFFGEPALDIHDFLRKDRDGRGIVNVLAADKLMRSPRLYATFLLWMLSELFEQLPEVGDLDQPKLVFFFDEAHLLFDSAPKALLTAIEQVVRLIRSKGVGVYFVTQNPLDVPETVLGQLGNRVQHALRAFTPRDQRAVKAAADTFRQNPGFDTATAIMQLGVGEALVSMLDEKGTPEMVARTLIAPPSARVGPITPEERQEIIKRSGLLGKYETAIDRESAFEVLQARGEGRMGQAGAPQSGSPGPNAGAPSQGGGLTIVWGWLAKIFTGGGTGKRQKMSPAELAMRSAVQSAARSAGTQIAHAILRGILGSMSSR